MDNSANISNSDVGQFACTAAEKNSLEMLKDIIRCGGNVSVAKSDGTTALHAAVLAGNAEIVEFLLDQRADADKPDNNGWTARSMADQQGNEEIKSLFERTPKRHAILKVSEQSTPVINTSNILRLSLAHTRLMNEMPTPRRRRANNFNNSLFGIISAAANAACERLPVSSTGQGFPVRVTICPRSGEEAGKQLVFLPGSLQELLGIGAMKFEFTPTKVLTKDGAEIDDIKLIRDGDHLILVGDDGVELGGASQQEDVGD